MFNQTSQGHQIETGLQAEVLSLQNKLEIQTQKNLTTEQNYINLQKVNK